MKAKSFSLIFLRKQQIVEDTYSFYFRAPSLFTYTAGQYLQLTLSHGNVDERGSQRFFTIASAPEEEEIMITCKRGRSSFKKFLFELTPGTTVNCFAPMGKFVL